MKKTNVIKIFSLVILLIFTIVIGKIFTKTSYGADNDEKAILEGAFDKYINYELSDGSKGTLVQYSLRTGITYNSDFVAIRNSEINASLNQIDGKYPSYVKVIAKSTKVTNGKTTDINEDYSYDANTGIVTIRTNNENENGEPIYNTKPEENDRDEYTIISYYDTYTNENLERDLECKVSYKAILFTEDNREVIAEGSLNRKVTENIGELTSISTNTSDIYNGYIKSNIINGTSYDTEYTENNEIMISKKEAHQKIKITEENTYSNLNDINYKSTKILKDDILNVLGENGKLEILDENNNVLTTIDNNTEFNESGEFVFNYGDNVNNITIKTSNIENEGVLHIENVKTLKSDVSNLEDRDILRKVSVIGINEKEIEKVVEDQEEVQENEEGLILNTDEVINEENNEVNVEKEIVEEESYTNEKENIIEIKESTTKVDFNVSNTEWTNKAQNEVTFDIYLNSSSKEYNLFKNPTIRINMPIEVEKVVLDNSQITYANGLSLNKIEVVSNEDESLSIVASLMGMQTQYNENDLGLITKGVFDLQLDKCDNNSG